MCTRLQVALCRPQDEPGWWARTGPSGKLKKGCFSIVLEKVPSKLAKEVSSKLQIPTIGIGAGKHVNGQVLVTHDMLGMTQDFNPRFIRRYADLNKEISSACKNYIRDVKENTFPNENESY